MSCSIQKLYSQILSLGDIAAFALLIGKAMPGIYWISIFVFPAVEGMPGIVEIHVVNFEDLKSS